uniref:BolA-like protein 3 n=1 Tax=Globodera rostochiensis TaxID=31243 RepID=A0A914GRG4_GLORO
MSIWRRLPFRKALPFIHSGESAVLGLVPSSTPFFVFRSVPSLIAFRTFADGHMADEGETDGSLVHVEDISGGCGAMFHVRVESPQFSGMTRVNQHKMINEVLRSEIRDMHGITIETKALVK